MSNGHEHDNCIFKLHRQIILIKPPINNYGMCRDDEGYSYVPQFMDKFVGYTAVITHKNTLTASKRYALINDWYWHIAWTSHECGTDDMYTQLEKILESV